MLKKKTLPKSMDRLTFDNIPLNHYFCDYIHIWKKVKSKEVYGGQGEHPNFAPEYPVMFCYDVLLPKKEHQFEKGSWTEDYFGTKFDYITDSKELVDKFIKRIRKAN